MPGLEKQVLGSGSEQAKGPQCQTPDPIAVIEEEHALQLEFCDVLELIADSLPNRLNQDLTRIAVPILRNSMPLHMKLEEEVLFPLMRKRVAGAAHLAAVLDRLEDEHETDEDLAAEIADALEAVGKTGIPDNPEMLGYMLRAFFDSQRRHIAWENRVVLPLARDILLPSDLADFQAWIMESGRPMCAHKSLLELRSAGATAGLCKSCRNSQRPA
jgi:hemerythrin-like domain-containing protein